MHCSKRRAAFDGNLYLDARPTHGTLGCSFAESLNRDDVGIRLVPT
jgi:hypothetical protein